MTIEEVISYMELAKEGYEVLTERLKSERPSIDFDTTYSKVLEAFDFVFSLFRAAPIDAYDGLKRKYIVLKSDTGEGVENCFVLRPDKDPAAIAALRAYAEVTDNKTLADDIINWAGAEKDKTDGKPKTRADEIRSMSDKELTRFLCDLQSSGDCDPCEFCDAKEYCYNDHNGFVDWLKQPAEE